MSDTTTSPVAGGLATQPLALPMGDLRLIGTFGGAGARRGLVLLPDGRTRMVSRGDMLAGARIEEVFADALSLLRPGSRTSLPLFVPDGLIASPRPRPQPRRVETPDWPDVA